MSEFSRGLDDAACDAAGHVHWSCLVSPGQSEREEELKRLLMRVKEESEKAGLKLNIKKTKIMASSPITSRQTEWEKMDRVYFGGSKITADGDCSHEIKRCLPLVRKVMTNLGSTLKSRDITLLIKVRLVKAMVFPIVCMDVRMEP